jgi:hypothetical protein
VNIIDMALIIGGVANQLLPIMPADMRPTRARALTLGMSAPDDSSCGLERLPTISEAWAWLTEARLLARRLVG